MSTRRARIAFWGNFGTGNWGNECTLQAIVHNARRLAPNAELVCICSEPEDTRERHGIEAFPISSLRRVGATPPKMRLPKAARIARRASIEAREWAQTLNVARTVDAMVMTGTGMLTDDSEGAFGLPYDLFKWALAIRACGGRVRFASVGVEAIDTPAARFFILSSLRMADYRSYRDLHSKQQLQKSGFDDARDPIFPDLAFSLPARKNGGGSRPPGSPRVVAVGLYNYKGRGLGSASDARAYRDYLEKLAAFVAWLLEHGFRVRVLIGDLTYDEGVLNDFRALLDAKGMRRDGARLEDSAARSVADVMDQIAAVDIVVASRFHNVLLALFLGKPVVSISYNEKNDALMAAMGLERYCQWIDDFAIDRLRAQFLEVERDGEAIRGTIALKAESFRQQLEDQYLRLFANLG